MDASVCRSVISALKEEACLLKTFAFFTVPAESRHHMHLALRRSEHLNHSDVSSSTGSNASCIDVSSSTGRNSSCIEESSSTGSNSSCIDVSSSTGSNSSCIDVSSSTGSNSSCIDMSSSTGSNSSCIDVSSSTGSNSSCIVCITSTREEVTSIIKSSKMVGTDLQSDSFLTVNRKFERHVSFDENVTEFPFRKDLPVSDKTVMRENAESLSAAYSEASLSSVDIRGLNTTSYDVEVDYFVDLSEVDEENVALPSEAVDTKAQNKGLDTDFVYDIVKQTSVETNTNNGLTLSNQTCPPLLHSTLSQACKDSVLLALGNEIQSTIKRKNLIEEGEIIFHIAQAQATLGQEVSVMTAQAQAAPGQEVSIMMAQAQVTPGQEVSIMMAQAQATPGQEVSVMTAQAQVTPGQEVSIMTAQAQVTPGQEVSIMMAQAQVTPGQEVSVMTAQAQVTPGQEVSIMMAQAQATPGQEVSVMMAQAQVTPGQEVSIMTAQAQVAPGQEVSVMENVAACNIPLESQEDNVCKSDLLVLKVDSLNLDKSKVCEITDIFKEPIAEKNYIILNYLQHSLEEDHRLLKWKWHGEESEAARRLTSQRRKQKERKTATSSEAVNATSDIGSTNDDSTSGIVYTNDDATSVVGSTNDDAPSGIGTTNDDATSDIESTNDDATSVVGFTNADVPSGIGSTNDDATSDFGSTNDNATSDIGSANNDARSAIGFTNDDDTSDIGFTMEGGTSEICFTNDDETSDQSHGFANDNFEDSIDNSILIFSEVVSEKPSDNAITDINASEEIIYVDTAIQASVETQDADTSAQCVIYDDSAAQTDAPLQQCCNCGVLSLPLNEQVKIHLRDEISRRITLENLVKIIEQESFSLRYDLMAERTTNMQLGSEIGDLKAKCREESHIAAEYKTRCDELERTVEGCRQMNLQLEDQLLKTNYFKSGIDYMLEAKLAEGRALEKETKLEMIQNELLNSQQELQKLLTRLAEVNREKSESVSSGVHIELLKIADDRAKDVERKCAVLESKLHIQSQENEELTRALEIFEISREKEKSQRRSDIYKIYELNQENERLSNAVKLLEINTLKESPQKIGETKKRVVASSAPSKVQTTRLPPKPRVVPTITVSRTSDLHDVLPVPVSPSRSVPDHSGFHGPQLMVNADSDDSDWSDDDADVNRHQAQMLSVRARVSSFESIIPGGDLKAPGHIEVPKSPSTSSFLAQPSFTSTPSLLPVSPGIAVSPPSFTLVPTLLPASPGIAVSQPTFSRVARPGPPIAAKPKVAPKPTTRSRTSPGQVNLFQNLMSQAPVSVQLDKEAPVSFLEDPTTPVLQNYSKPKGPSGRIPPSRIKT